MGDERIVGRGRKLRTLVNEQLPKAKPFRPVLAAYTDGQVALPFFDPLGGSTHESLPKRFSRALEHVVCAMYGGVRGEQFPLPHPDREATMHIPDVIVHRRNRLVSMKEIKALQPGSELHIKDYQWSGYRGLQEAHRVPVSAVIFRHTAAGLGVPVFGAPGAGKNNPSEREMYRRAGESVVSAVEVPFDVLTWLIEHPEGPSRSYAGDAMEPYRALRSSVVDTLLFEPRALLESRKNTEPWALPRAIYGAMRVEHYRTPPRLSLWGEPVKPFLYTKITLPYSPDTLPRVLERLPEAPGKAGSTDFFD